MAQKWKDPTGESGVLDCLAGRRDTSDYTPLSGKHNLRLLPCADDPGDFATGQRLERIVEHVHALGPRVFAELLAEIATATGEPGLIADRLQAYAALNPEAVRFVGGDQFPPMPLGLVR